MLDLTFILVTIAYFVANALFAVACSQLMGVSR
jgi:hypothetical protein